MTLKRDDFGKLAQVCDRAVAAGVTTLSELRFEVENDNKLRAEALAKATSKAREKAEAIAKASGASIVGIQSISEEWWPSWLGEESYRYRYAQSEMAFRAAAPSLAAMPAGAGAEMAPAEAPTGAQEVPGALRMDCSVVVEFLVR